MSFQTVLSKHGGITAAIRSCAEEIGEAGEFAPQEVADLVMERHADLIAFMGRQLAREALINRVRDVLKLSAPKAAGFARPLFDVVELDLPSVLSLDINGGRWVYLKKASIKEVRMHREVIHVGILRDQESLRKMDAFLDIIEPASDDEDEGVMMVLDRIAEQRTADEDDQAEAA